LPTAHEIAEPSVSLRLHDDRRQPRRHPAGDPEELKDELPGEEREADRDQRGPRHAGPRQHDHGERRDQEARRGELRRGEIVEADPRRHEREAPDDGDEQRPAEVARAQRGRAPPPPRSRRTSSVC